MTPSLEILLPVRPPDAGLSHTIASLAAQTDQGFAVRLSEDSSLSGADRIEEAARQLAAAGIEIFRTQESAGLKRLEHWNRLHAEAKADWLKPLLPGETLKPDYVARLKKRLEEKPAAQLVRCDAELKTEWGLEISHAPFEDLYISAAQVSGYFPARIDWLCRAANVAYSRTAWLATGGFCPQLPGFASLNLNITLALHYGVENIPESLVQVESGDRLPLNESAGERVNFPLELWLVLRQARNYCLAAKVPWRCRSPWWRAMAARMGHW